MIHRIEDMPIAKLDLFAVGDQMFRLPLVAVMLGHSNLQKSHHYMHPQTLQARYVDDVVYGLAQGEMSTAEFSIKWYGSEDAAIDVVNAVFDHSPRAHHATATEAR